MRLPGWKMETLTIDLDGSYEISKENVLITISARGLQCGPENNLCYPDTIWPGIGRQGWPGHGFRVQQMRKNNGYEVTDNIGFSLMQMMQSAWNILRII